ncbi:MAG: ATP-binding protein [bacterium]|nr:ATP-binding protein [bacterium]
MNYLDILIYACMVIVGAVAVVFAISWYYTIVRFWNGIGLVGIEKTFSYDLDDLAVSFFRAVEDKFGKSKFQGIKVGLVKRVPITYKLVKVDIDKDTQVVVGDVEVGGIKGFFRIGGEKGEPILYAYVKKIHMQEVRNLFESVSHNLEHSSIYKNKAFSLPGRNFINLSDISEDMVTYNESVLSELKAKVWAFLEQGDRCLEFGLKLQSKILFLGQFGSGKSLAALITAKKAVKNKWTFVYLEPTIQSASSMLDAVIKFSRIYQPVVVLIEDFDREQRSGNTFAVGRIMSAMDDITTKDDEILILMTSNYPDKIEPGIQRPGRIDECIDFGVFKQEDAKKLLVKLIPPDMLSPAIDWKKVLASCEGYMPSFVVRMGESAKLLAISESNGSEPVVTDAMLINAAEKLRKRHNTCSVALGFQKD